jgi:recombination protein RecA
MRDDVIKSLKTAGLLSDQKLDLGFVSTGSYALNKICSGDYQKGIPIGMITQFHGEASTAKTVFVTHILANAQKQGYHTVLIDAENAYNSEFASTLGIDPNNLIYAAPHTLEDCFATMETLIREIREVDKETPIVIGYDSIAVSPSKEEMTKTDYESHQMTGAMRAKVTGACLRKINPLLREFGVALVIVNQIRNKVGVMYGDPRTPAAGGKSLEYYLGLNFMTSAPKNERIQDDNKSVVGIRGKVANVKNKVTKPFQDAEFELLYDVGLTSHYGVLDHLVKDGIVERSGAWYQYKDEPKFQSKTFNEGFMTDDKFKTLRQEIGL